ncbi:MAG TPA: tRNA 2-thiouridine(34) synthase MnmA [Tenericutes bacterium]|jgi:tRNA-specific 2-thiouridylase|nr:tRNA 2-thiouridine(34) synthase MnmA [Mycoplasmatota bacterium]
MKKVIVGISGGVDSSVAAILLKEAGYEVIGAFMRNWDSALNNDILGNPTLQDEICPQEVDYNDTKEVCEKLNIPLHRVDFVKEYWDYVFTYFLDELKAGRTPNPDIMCNKYIKFDLFIEFAKSLGADYVATGHYARLEDGKLLRGVDKNKDQTYFLSQLSNKQLENILFPIGHLTKEEVRKIAKSYNLKTADKKDSTGICFIGERNFSKFLNNYFPRKEGDIVDIRTNEVVGKHYGVINYTIGQRKGIGIGGAGEPWFVVGKNAKENIVYVAQGEDNEYLYSDEALITNINWISDKKPDKCTAKFRYRQKDNDVTLEFLPDGNIKVKYPQKIKAVTPGQACVFYLGEECLGGGIIEEVYINNEKLQYLN